MVQAARGCYKGGVQPPFFMVETGGYMRRRNVSGRKYAKNFTRKRKRTRAINSGATVLRGGIRL